jgi:DNA-3-methyladenine glycosylase II
MKRHIAKIRPGVAHLRKNDPVIGDLIRRCPPVTSMTLEPNRFKMLVHSILSQQISVHAARAIRGRLTELAGARGMKPDTIASLDTDQLREIGVSRVKAGYLKDLAERVASGQIQLNQIGRRKDEVAIQELTQVKGIGVWTAQMFLIFSLGRLDVFPHDDYGVRSAIRNLYALDELPDRTESHTIAAPWHPYATIATWYLWRSHELKQKSAGGN